MISKTKLTLWLTALALVMACAPVLSSAPPPAPTLDPNAIDRIIAQTANAASTQTARVVPTKTATNTPTPKPRGTNTPEPSVTNTLIYIFETPTTVVLPTFGPTFSPTSKKDYDCTVLNSPEDRVIYAPRMDFKVRWRLRNVGRQHWYGSDIDFVYDFGDRFHKVSGYDIGKEVEIGDVAEMFVDMKAPKDPGTYTTHWAMQRGTEKFCKVKLTIIVK